MEFKLMYLFGLVALAVLAMLIFVITVEVVPCNRVELFDPNVDLNTRRLQTVMRDSTTSVNALIDKAVSILYPR